MNLTEADTETSAVVIPLADSEKALVALAQRHDQAAFHKLYKLHLNRVYGLCLRLTGTAAMAEEATQEVFLQLWRKLHTFTGDSAFSTWLHSVATNTTLSYLRRQKGWLGTLKSRFQPEEDEGDACDQQEAPAAPDLNLLDRLLPRLPERARVVFVLHALEGYRHEQIAKAMGITSGASKAHFHRARTLITEWLESGQ